MLLPHLAAVLLPLGLGAYARSRNAGRLVGAFVLLLLAQSAWAALGLLKMVLPSLLAKSLCDDLEFFAAGWVAVAILAFSLRYGGAELDWSRPPLLILLCFPFIALLYALGDPWHHLLRPDAMVDAAVPWGELRYTVGLPTYLAFAPLFATGLAGIGHLAYRALRKPAGSATGDLLAILGLVFPVLGALSSLRGVRIGGRVDTSSLWLASGQVLLLVGVFRHQLAGILPAAWAAVIEHLGDAVLVVDRGGRVAGANPACLALLGGALAPSRAALEAFASWPVEARAVIAGTSHAAEVVVPAPGGGERCYAVSSFAVPGLPSVRAVRLRDDTDLRDAERGLRDLMRELEDRVRERSAELEREALRRREVQESLAALNTELGRTQREIMFTLSELVEDRCDETVRHVARVSEFVRILALGAGLDPAEADLLADASAMHDIGKIGVPDRILRKPGPLTEAELEVARSHTRIGHEILSRNDRPLTRAAALIALEHHERWDGEGYPAGLSGEAISLGARIVSLCDVFDSMSAGWGYHPAREDNEVLAFLRAERGRRFDPRLVDLFFARLDAIEGVRRELPDSSPRACGGGEES